MLNGHLKVSILKDREKSEFFAVQINNTTDHITPAAHARR